MLLLLQAVVLRTKAAARFSRRLEDTLVVLYDMTGVLLCENKGSGLMSAARRMKTQSWPPCSPLLGKFLLPPRRRPSGGGEQLVAALLRSTPSRR